ncbi:alpha/beta hydrolase [Phyllobacterium endophyticum]|uniref:alpha/beta hydrolase n=1 Tax=Phyllobacterium endophyticum TaxID=1149773 RepID=UPI0011CC4434|nr:alpha/beta hydrolase [Phyllobacterium endophyticum]TXR47301.1 alpha/beta hydrolase [Phyllobacterium endophyticum]
MHLDPFRTRDHVPDFDDQMRDYIVRSDASRSSLRMIGDIAYGTDSSEKLDLFFPDEDTFKSPVHMFIHGGYWRMFSKEDFSFIAETVTKTGAIAVIINYALMPAVRMAAIVDQVQRAKLWVQQNIATYGGDPQRLTISGHSAGGHLCAFLFNDAMASSGICGALLLSGLYDLKPLQSSFLQPEIAITAEEVRDFTPLTHRYDPRVSVSILVGERETEPFHRQAFNFASLLSGQGLSVACHKLHDANHMSGVRDLGVADSEAGILLGKLIRSCSKRIA